MAKGAKMIAYHNQPIHEFINQLRDIAINAKARASVIDQIDALILIPSEDKIAADIEAAEYAAEKRGFEAGREDALADKANAVEDAEKAIYKECCDAIEAKGKDIGLTDEQIYKVVNHILWDCRP